MIVNNGDRLLCIDSDGVFWWEFTKGVIYMCKDGKVVCNNNYSITLDFFKGFKDGKAQGFYPLGFKKIEHTATESEE